MSRSKRSSLQEELVPEELPGSSGWAGYWDWFRG